MLKLFRFLFLVLVMVGSLVLGPVTTVHALTYPAEINKTFTPIAITSGGISKLRVTVYNANTNPLTSAAWTDNLVGVQPGLRVATPLVVTNTCGGTITAVAGGTSIALSGGTVPAQVGSIIGSCYVEVNVTSTTPGNLINTIPAGALSSSVLDAGVPVAISNTSDASATLNVIAVQAPSLSKAFAPNTIFAGQTSTLTITIRNNDLNASLTNTTFTDALPTNIVIAAVPNIVLTGCGPGYLTGVGALPLAAGDTSISLNSGTILKNSNCVIAVDVTSVKQGVYTNTIPAGVPSGGSIPISTQQGVTNASPASAPLNVQAFNLTKSFATSPIAVGQTSMLTITVANPSTFAYTGVKIPDTLPAGLEYFIGTPTTTGCGPGTLEGPTSGTPLASGDTTLNLVGGTISAGGSCIITVPVLAKMNAAAQTYTNTIPIGALVTDQGNSNHLAASAPLAVQSLSISKAFAPTTFAAGSTSTLTITISNPSPNPFTGATLADTLPTTPNSNLKYTGIPTTSCVGGAVALSGAPTRTVTLTGGTIPGGSIATPGTCTITAIVTTDANAPAAAYTSNPNANTIPANALTTTEGGTNAVLARGPITVTTVSASKTFTPNTISAGGTSALRITITNPVNGLALSGINFTDSLPVGLQITGTPTTTCVGGTVTNTLTTVTLTGGTLPAAPVTAQTCRIDASVTTITGISSGVYTNTINPGDLTSTGPGGPGTGPTNSTTFNRTLTVQAVSAIKSFSPVSFQAGGTSTLTITLQNFTGSAYNVSTFTDTLPATPNTNLTVNGLAVTDCVGGTPSTTLPRTVSMTGGVIPAGSLATPGTCTITVQVTAPLGAPDATYTNTINPGDLTTVQGAQNTNTSSAPVSVYTLGQGVSATKSFTPSSIQFGGNAALTITVNAPADTDLTAFFVTDNLPGDLTISNSTAPSVTGCGAGVLSSVLGASTISLTSGTVTRGTPCVIIVYVTSSTGSTPGVVNTNTINPGNITNTEARTVPAPISATLTVLTTSTLTTSKAFYPDAVSPNGLSTLSITMTNTGSSNLVGFVLSDTLPGSSPNEIVIAPTPNASTTCGGTLTATAGSKTISLSNGTIPSQVGGVPGICTINVDVQGLGATQTHTNTIPASSVTGTIQGTSSTMNAQGPASAPIKIQNLSIEIVKGFNPTLVHGGTSSTLSIQLRNPNLSAVLTGITFTDTMPVGMYIADVPNFVVSAIGDCGPGATLTGVPETNTFTFSGGTLAANTSCTMTLSATIVVNGNLTNTIPIAAVSTFNGVKNQSATSASLTNLAGASISKGFAPNPINAGLANYSLLTITIRNTETIPLSGMGLVDNLPAGLQVAGGSAPAPVNNCGGTLTATVGATSIQLTGASLPRVVAVGDIIKCTLIIPVTGATPGVYTNTIPGNTLTTVEGATNVDPTTATLTLNPFSLGNRVWYDTNNNGIVDSGELGISGVRVELYRDNGSAPGVFDATDAFVGFQTTNATGYYRFDDLGADDYVVVIPTSQFNGGPLAGYLSSGSSMAADGTITDSFSPDADTTVTDSDDNGASIFVSNSLSYVSAQAVTIGPGSTEPIGEADPSPNPAATGEAVDNQSDRTVDFGFYRIQLGNQVFSDLNGNGIFDGGDTPVASAVVQLFASNGTTEIRVGPDGILGTADDATGGVITGAGGTYQFSGLAAGDYIVKVTPPSAFSTTDSENLIPPNSDTLSPNNNIDNNDNGKGISGGQVSSNIFTLTPGVVGASTTVTNSTATTLNPSLDFGFVLLYSLGNRVWFDTDNSHTINGSEVGINGVRVELYADTNNNGSYDAGDTFAGFQTTDTNGYYLFNGLTPGNYVVVIPSSVFGTGGLLKGYWNSGTSMAADGSIADGYGPDPDTVSTDSDDNGVSAFIGNVLNYVSSQAVTLGPGSAEPITDTDPVTNPISGEAANDHSDRTLDFGFYRAELGNQVFVDVNSNGTYNNVGDVKLSGAIVKLYAGNGTTEINIGPDGILGSADDAPGGVTTGVAGTYLFSNLPQGNYIVKVTPPLLGYTSAIDTFDATDSGNPNTNTDNNDNGLGILIGQAASNAIPLTPGAITANNTVNNATGTTSNPTLDFGFDAPIFSLGNRVWFDTNNDSTRGASEVGVDGVYLELYAADGLGNPIGSALANTTTSGGGYYLFNRLLAGNYVVVIPADNFINNASNNALVGYWSSGTTINATGGISELTAPSPEVSTSDTDDNGTRQTSGSFSGAVISATVTLGPGTTEPTFETDPVTNPITGEAPDDQSNRTVDFGFYRVELSNQIFVDHDNDGSFNTGDLGLPSARVQLFANDGVTEILVGPDGILGTVDDAAGGVTTTASGVYLFSGLPAGSYRVSVTPPAGYASTVDTAALADTVNPNLANTDNNDNGVGTATGQVFGNSVTLNPGIVIGGITPSNVDDASGTTSNPTMDFGFTTSVAKTLISTDASHTTGAQVAIGEILTYQVVLQIPAGPLTGVRLVDSPQSGLAFVDCIDINIPAGVTSTTIASGACNSADGTTPGTSNPLIQSSGQKITFDFGDVTNSSALPQPIIIQYSVIVLDVAANRSGGTLNNSVVWTWNGGLRSTSATPVEIVEPRMIINKSATPTNADYGSVITFTLDLAHDLTNSTTDAFDVVVTDQIPAGLSFIPGSITSSGTAALSVLTPPSYNSGTNTLTFVWDVFRLNETASVSFQATFNGPAPVVNSASVEWSSLLIDPSVNNTPPTPDVPVQLSPYNINATERWYDPSAPAGVNNYAVDSAVELNILGKRRLPGTGFEPNVVTQLPGMPAGFEYANTDVWVEIPQLKLKLDIVGIPFNEDENTWDLKWLSNNAGWLNGTAFPTYDGNSALTAHSTLANGKPGPFANLALLKYGDQIFIHIGGQKYIYEVQKNFRVSPTSVDDVLKHEEKSWLTLITCSSYNEKTKEYTYRSIVRAVLIKVVDE